MDYRMDAWLTLLRMVARSETLDRLHAAVEQEITAASRHIHEAEHDGGEDYLDAVTDEECERIEELLALAFVTGQSFITSVRTRIAALFAGLPVQIWLRTPVRQ